MTQLSVRTDDMAVIRRSFVMDEIIAGNTLNKKIAERWNEIHPAHPTTASIIQSDRKIVMDMLASQTTISAFQVRELQAARLDRVISALNERVVRGDLHAIDRYLKAVAQQSLLYGANMPSKIAFTDPSGEKEARSLSDEERLTRILEILDSAKSAHEESIIDAEVVR